EWGGWLAPSRQEVIATLNSLLTASKAGQAAPDIPVAAAEQFDRIKTLAARGDITNGLAELDNLLVAYPGNASIYELKCELMFRRLSPDAPKNAKVVVLVPGTDKAARAACARVSELAPGEPAPHFTVAEALLRDHDFRAAHKELEIAAGKIAALK